MSEENWGPCPACKTPLSRGNASRLRSGAVVHVGCKARSGFAGALLEEVARGEAGKTRFSALAAGLPDPGMPGDAPLVQASGPTDYEALGRERYRDSSPAMREAQLPGVLAQLRPGTPEEDRLFANGWLAEHARAKATPSGEVCKNGHGGAEGVPPPARKPRRQVSLRPEAAPAPPGDPPKVLVPSFGTAEVLTHTDPGEFALALEADRTSTRTGPNIDVRSPAGVVSSEPGGTLLRVLVGRDEAGKLAATELGPDGTEVVELPPLAKAEPPPAPMPAHMLVPGFPGHACCGVPGEAPKPAVPPTRAKRASRGKPAVPASPGSPASPGTAVATDRAKVTCADCLEVYDDAEALAGRIEELEPAPTDEELEVEELLGERRAEEAARARRSVDQMVLLELTRATQPERHPDEQVHLFDGYPGVAQHRTSGLSEARCGRATSIKVGLLTAVPFVAGHPRCCPACAALPQPYGARSYGAFVPAGDGPNIDVRSRPT